METQLKPGTEVIRAYIKGEVEYVTKDGKECVITWNDGLHTLHLVKSVERWVVELTDDDNSAVTIARTEAAELNALCGCTDMQCKEGHQ